MPIKQDSNKAINPNPETCAACPEPQREASEHASIQSKSNQKNKKNSITSISSQESESIESNSKSNTSVSDLLNKYIPNWYHISIIDIDSLSAREERLIELCESIIKAHTEWVESDLINVSQNFVDAVTECYSAFQSGAIPESLKSLSSAIEGSAILIAEERFTSRLWQSIAAIRAFVSRVRRVPKKKTPPNLEFVRRNIERKAAICWACAFVRPRNSESEEFEPWPEKLEAEIEYQLLNNVPLFLTEENWLSTEEIRAKWRAFRSLGYPASAFSESGEGDKTSDLPDSLLLQVATALENSEVAESISQRLGLSTDLITAVAGAKGLILRTRESSPVIPQQVIKAIKDDAARAPNASYSDIASRVSLPSAPVSREDVQFVLGGGEGGD